MSTIITGVVTQPDPDRAATFPIRYNGRKRNQPCTYPS